MACKPHSEGDHRYPALCYVDEAIAEHAATPHGGGGLPEGIDTDIDQFGRPQIWDRRSDAGTGAVYRQGGWGADGDPLNLEGQGIVIYGPNEDGVLAQSGGGYARIKAQRIGLAEIIAGVNGGNLFYLFRIDTSALTIRDRNNVLITEIRRSDGRAWFKELRIGGGVGPRVLSGAGSPEGVIAGAPGDLYLNTSGGSGTTLYVKESGTSNTGWTGK